MNRGIKMVGKEESKEVVVVEEKKIPQQLAVFQQSEEAIVEAGKLLEGFESIYEDEEKRTRATGSAGIVAASGINFLLDSAEAKDEDEKSVLKEKGATTLMELGVAGLKTLIAGERRRKARRK